MAVFSRLAKTLEAKPTQFQISGSKDKYAKTYQKVTATSIEPLALKSALNRDQQHKNSVTFGDFEYVSEPLDFGLEIKGNAFEIVLRNVDEDQKSRLDEAFESLKQNGFLNYFGLQRFGTSENQAWKVGLAFIQRNFAKAVDVILSPSDIEEEDVKKALEVWSASKDALTAYNMIKNKRRVRGMQTQLKIHLLKALSRKEDFEVALKSIPMSVRIKYLFSLSSYVFNRALSERCRRFGPRTVLVGDLYAVDDENVDVATSEDVSENRISIEDVLFPTPGFKSHYPDNECRSIFDSVLSELELEKGFPEADEDRAWTVGGDYRKLIAVPEMLKWQTFRYDDPYANDESENGRFWGLRLNMSLGKSQYATMAVREALSMPTDRGLQIQWIREHEKMVKVDLTSTCRKTIL